MSLYFIWKEIETYDASNRYDYAIFNDLKMAYIYGNSLIKEHYKKNCIEIPIENILDVGSIWIHYTTNEQQISSNIKIIPKEVAEESLKESSGRNFTADVFKKIYYKLHKRN